ncbi:HAD family hydrolase [Nocardia huaxiensis]|uniref:HAD family phosphatase n=1 Tax=Nocardia huaxiensis TaxID=2755382 RepID=A0A7D6ZTZ6_9NOCA|nr:HAD family phosphatase [Nocardia huaxiensis]QLY28629.1 HAD family phosphatase [Nocardia huaxiensis]UFS97900.1 HAD family phosphatase [Nocardia huaxiensis]
MTEPIAAVLFDLDGTLAATMEPWDRCWADYAAQHGHTWSDDDRARTHGHGDWAHHLARVCGIASPEQVVAACVELMVAQVEAGAITMLPGVRTLLDTASGRVPTGVVSASPRRFVHATLDHFGLRDSLRIVVTREDQARTKPHPAPWLHAAALLGVGPGSCVAVEDSAAGIRSAHAAGMRVLAIPSWPPSRHPAEAGLAAHIATDAILAEQWLRDTLTELAPAH